MTYRCYGDTKHLRKLFQKALSSVKDWPESIANAWIDFERDEGTLEQMEFCEVKTKEKLDKVMEERQKMQQAPLSESSMQNKKANKRKLIESDTGKWKDLEIFSSKIVKTDMQIKSKLQKSHLNISKTANDKNLEEQKIAPPPGFKMTEDKDTNDKDRHEINSNITIFISNLDYTATEDEVKTTLKSIGPITSFKMIKDYKGRSKGYCYVQLSSVVCNLLVN